MASHKPILVTLAFLDRAFAQLWWSGDVISIPAFHFLFVYLDTDFIFFFFLHLYPKSLFFLFLQTEWFFSFFFFFFSVTQADGELSSEPLEQQLVFF